MNSSKTTHIHLVGEASAEFLSQIAFFVRSVRRLYPKEFPFRVRCFLGGKRFNRDLIPKRILDELSDVEFIYAGADEYAKRSFFAQCDDAYRNIADDAELIVFADADTCWLKRFDDLLETVALSSAIAGSMVHFPPPGTASDVVGFWEAQFQHFLSRSAYFHHAHSLDRLILSPFCPNFAFVVIPAKYLRMFGRSYLRISDELQSKLSNPYFSYQVALTIWLEKHNITAISLPMRYNFPNDDRALAQYGYQIDDIYVMHYLRERAFKRREIWLTKGAYEEFLVAAKGPADRLLAHMFHVKLQAEKWFDGD